MDECREADLYVRDNLLIQWLMYRVTRRDKEEFLKLNIEDIYSQWKEWLDYKEGNSDKIRS